ncbi:MAG: energy-coupling factor ABC transporter ATP-binding protein [Ignavibacteriae bacterium]|nr:energy-coupling factor ABC transporter ATP-binding protein [Ignavibacteriota bacterium]
MLTLEDVTYAYPGGEPVLRNVSLEGSQGEVLLILGHNGAGKSTLLKLLNGILTPTNGRVLVEGKDTKTVSTAILAKDVAVTFQNPRDQIFASTINNEVEFGPRILDRPNTSELVKEALRLFGFAQEGTRHPYDLPLSRQKLLTAASAAASGASILAFDEPSAGLSIPERRILIEGLQQIRENKLVLIVSHDLDVFLPLATRVLVFHHGKLSSDAAPSMIYRDEKILRTVSLKLPLALRLQKFLSSAQQKFVV